MTAAGIRPVTPKREAPVGHHVAERCSKTLTGVLILGMSRHCLPFRMTW